MTAAAPEKRPLSIRLSPLTANKLKAIAASRGKTSAAIVEELLIVYVADNIGAALASLQVEDEPTH